MQTLSSLISEPTQNDRKAFASVSGGNAPAMTFTRDQLRLIADALAIAELHFVTRSETFTIDAECAEHGSPRRRNAAIKADDLFRKSCDARELSERISRELWEARK